MFPAISLNEAENGGGGNRTRVVFPPAPHNGAKSGLEPLDVDLDSLPRYVNRKGVPFRFVATIEGESELCICCPEAGADWYVFERPRHGAHDAFVLCTACFSETVYGKTGVLSGVYFMRAGKFVKIGHSADIAKRMREFSTGCPYPLELWHHIRGTQDDERALHNLFAEDRAQGEWFRVSGRIRDYVLALGGRA